jgi:adenylate kinase family enzyme
MTEPWYEYKPDYTWMKSKMGTNKTYDLDTVSGRRDYYAEKVGAEIDYLKEYFKKQTFLGYWMAPKQAGKGTYMNGLKEIFGAETFSHVSVGDVVRAAHVEFETEGKDSEVYQYASKFYRGDMHLDEAFEALVGRTTSALVPTELVMVLVRRIIEKTNKKSLFIDGFPRNLDQVSYSLYFRELINYRDDPDVFILINAPITVLDERMKQRRTCLTCGNSRGISLLPTEHRGYDKEKDEFYLICDLPGCTGGRMVTKEGDHLGIEVIKDRVMMDVEVMKRARKLFGIPKIELYNSYESAVAFDYIDEYELTSACDYSLGKDGEVVMSKVLWELTDGKEKFYSLLPAAVVVQLVKQLAAILGYKK